jgi:hypothetical protein
MRFLFSQKNELIFLGKMEIPWENGVSKLALTDKKHRIPTTASQRAYKHRQIKLVHILPKQG